MTEIYVFRQGRDENPGFLVEARGGAGASALIGAKFFKKRIALEIPIVIFHVRFALGEVAKLVKPLTDNCSLYGWTTYSYSP